MEFCPIVPIAYLEQFGLRTRHHMALAQWILRDRKYLEFFRGRVAAGDTVIMDNGAYEGEQLDNFDLLEAMRLLQPTVVVLPDSPGELLVTLRKSETFLNLLRKRHFRTNTMTVVHALDGNLQGFEFAYKMAGELSEWIGFSRLTKRYGTPLENQLDRRPKFIMHLKQKGLWYGGRHHHALGMNGYVDELRRLKGIGIRSLDSSSPVWRGLLGFGFDDLWPDVPLNMKPSYSPLNSSKAEANLKLVMEACGAKEVKSGA